jgi:hypothetical protein
MAYNRPKQCAAVFEALRMHRPRQLFFAVDGPRISCSTDREACLATRELVRLVDWPCTVHTFFRETNRGCKHAPPEAISWFFEHVPAGIILEDDCVPTADFLAFASELLDRYSADERIGMISGNNHFRFQTDRSAAYHFSQHASIWGWATWRRSWQLYDIDMKPYVTNLASIRERLGHSERYRAYWWRYVEAIQKGMNTWDIQWMIALRANDRLVIRPICNLVSNIGFTSDSTHTTFEYGADNYLRTQSLTFPLVHPPTITLDDSADRQYEARVTSYWRRGLTFAGSRTKNLVRCVLGH